MSERKNKYLARRSRQSDFSLLIRSARHRSGLIQKEVKQLTGIPQCKVSYYECDRQLPCERNLNKLLELYKVSLEERQHITREWSNEMKYLTSMTAK